jgi:hypothetical protein
MNYYGGLNDTTEPFPPPLRSTNDEYVVTLGMDFADNEQPARIIHELHRGDPRECLALMRRVSMPSHDKRVIAHWWLQCGRLADWEAFVLSS